MQYTMMGRSSIKLLQYEKVSSTILSALGSFRMCEQIFFLIEICIKTIMKQADKTEFTATHSAKK